MLCLQVISPPLVDLDFFMRAARFESQILQALTDLESKKSIDFSDYKESKMPISSMFTLVSGDASKTIHWFSKRRLPRYHRLSSLDTLPIPLRDKESGDLRYSSSTRLAFALSSVTHRCQLWLFSTGVLRLKNLATHNRTHAKLEAD